MQKFNRRCQAMHIDRKSMLGVGCRMVFPGKLPGGFALIVLCNSGASADIRLCGDEDEALTRVCGSESLYLYSLCFEYSGGSGMFG